MVIERLRKINDKLLWQKVHEIQLLVLKGF